MVQLAQTGFGPQHNFRKNNAPVECVIQSELATTSALVSLDSGADVMGKLLTGNVVTLNSGLTAVENKLGWTVFGKQKYCGKDKFTTFSMHLGNIPLQNLWELEVLGITDPTQKLLKKEKTYLILGKK
ncbi:integrase catalytic domain-containing protein [Trichonephila clavipes]|nr:integrase catalytic domain-containing protein [Trichonephila clavipes]